LENTRGLIEFYGHDFTSNINLQPEYVSNWQGTDRLHRNCWIYLCFV